MEQLRVTVLDGKYTVILPSNGGLKALRHGEEWRDCCGDGLILALAQEITILREFIEDCRDNILAPLAHEDTELGKRAEGLGAATVGLLGGRRQ